MRTTRSRLLRAVALLLAAAPAAAAEVELRARPVHGLVSYLATVAGADHHSRTLRELHRQGPLARDPAARDAVERYRALHADLEIGLSFPGFPATRHQGLDADQLVLAQSVSSRDLAELDSRIGGLLPAESHQELMALLRALEPRYRRAVWDPNERQLRRRVRQVGRLARRLEVGSLLDRARAFYRSSWSAGRPLEVGFYPIPAARGHVTAELLGGVASVGVLTGDDDPAGTLGVLLHELGHALWAAQPRAVQHELADLFAQHPSPHAPLAGAFLDEALATALGNGLVHRLATGRLDDDPWYDDPYVDGFARALEPRLERDLDAGGRLDAAFVDHAVAAFAAAFPDAPLRFDALLRSVCLVTEGDAARAAAALRRHFRVTSLARSSPLGHPTTASFARETAGTLVVVFTAAERNQARRFAELTPELGPAWEAVALDHGPLVWADRDPAGRARVVIQLDDPGGLDEAVAALADWGTVDPDQPLRRLPRPGPTGAP